MTILYVLVLLAIIVYILVLALSPKSKLLHSPYVKKGKEAQYKKTARVGLIGVAACMLGLAVVNGLAGRYEIGDPPLATLSVLNTVFACLALTGMLVLFLILRSLQDKEKRRMPVRPVAPREAFEFDEEDAPRVPNKPSAPKKGKKK